MKTNKTAVLGFFVAALAYASAASAYVSPGKPSGFVNDFAGIFEEAQRSSLESKLDSFEKESGAEISVVTVPSLDDETIESYAVKLFEEWGIGKEKEDNGLLLLVAPNEREVRIEVGYGLEPVVTDVASFLIIDEIIVPEFRAGDYFAGVDKAADQIIGLVKNDPEALGFVESRMSRGGPDLSSFFGIALVLVLNLIPVIIYSKSWWLGGVLGFVLGFVMFASVVPAAILALVGLVLDYLLSKKFGGKRPPGGGRHGGVWFGGLGGGRGSGGGFGGFGGGMSGGGGSSGRW